MKLAKNFLLGVAVIIGASCSTSVSTQALNPSMKTPILPPSEQPTKKTQPSTPVAVSKIVSSPVAFFGLPPVGQLIKCETKTKVTLGRQAIIENVTYKARILAVDGAGVSKFELLDLQHESSTPNQGGKRRLAKMEWERKGVQWQETITIDGKTEQSPAKFTVGWFLLDTIWNSRRFPKGKLKAGAAWDTNPRLHRMAFGFMFPEAGKSDILPFTAANSPLKCELEKTEMVNGQVIGTTGLGMSKGDRKNGKLFNIKLEGEWQHIAGVHLNSLQLKGRLDGQGQGGQVIGISLQHKESVLERAPVKFLKPGVGAQFAIQDSMQSTVKQYLNGQLKSGQSLNGNGSYVTKILSIENGVPKAVEITKIKNVISAKQNGRPQDVNINDPDARLVFRHQGGKWKLDEAASKMGPKGKYPAKIVASFYNGGGEGVPTIAGYARLFPDHPVKIGDTWQPNLTGSLFRFPGKTTCKLEDIREIDGITCAIFTFKGSGRKTERLNVSGIPSRPLFVNMTGNANHEGRVVYIIESGEVKECKYVSSSDAQGSNAQAGRFKGTSEESVQFSMVKIGGDTGPLITEKPSPPAIPNDLLQPLANDKHTVLLEHFENKHSGRAQGSVAYAEGRMGSGLKLTPTTLLLWRVPAIRQGTVEMWVKPDNLNTGQLTTAHLSISPVGLTVDMKLNPKGQMHTEIHSGGWRRSGWGGKIKIGEWQHVAATWGPSGVKTYINGKQIAAGPAAPLNRGTAFWVLGASKRSGKNGISGVVDEFRVSNIVREFSPEDFTSSREGKHTQKSTKTAEPKEPAFVKEGLVAYYPFNGNTKDESGNGNDGEVRGAILAANRHGEDGKAYSFDGKDDYLHILNNPSLNLKKGLTIAAWIKPTELIKNRSRYVLTKGSGYQNNYDFSLVLDGKEHKFGYGWRPSPPLAVGVSAAEFNFTVNAWVHVVATHDSGSSPVIYINGAGQALTVGSTRGRGKVTFPRRLYNQPLTIGMDPKGPSGNRNHFHGEIDDVRIYNRALSAEEVKALYDLEKPKTK